MGKLVSIWSTSKKQGRTTFLYSLANQLSRIVDKDLKILLLCTNIEHGNLLRLFGIDGHEPTFEDIVNYKIDPCGLFNVSNVAAKKNNLYFLGSRSINTGYTDRNMRICGELTDELKSNFDLIFADPASGCENALTNMIIEKSDHILNVLTQDKELLDRYPFVKSNDLAYIVNFYRDIYPNERDLITLYKLKEIFMLPNCDVFQEMKNKNKLENYIYHDTEYNKSVNKIMRFLVKSLEIPIAKEDLVYANVRKNLKKGIFGGLLQ